jgi:hypothetical protein
LRGPNSLPGISQKPQLKQDKEAAAHKIRFAQKLTEQTPGKIEQIQRYRPTLHTTDIQNKYVQDDEMECRNEELRQVAGYKGLQGAQGNCLTFLRPHWDSDIHNAVLVEYGDERARFEVIAENIFPFKTSL